MNDNIKYLIGDIINDLINNGITVKLDNVKISACVEDNKNISCEGWFSDEKKELVCSVGLPTEIWVPTLTHEYIHFKQWEEKSPLYTSSNTDLIFNNFIDGNEVDPKKLSRAIFKIQAMEFDCEKRSIDMMVKHNLPFDMIRINRRANAYIYYYSIAQRLGGWYSTSPSMVKEIVDKMPGFFLTEAADYEYVGEYTCNVEPKLFSLYKKFCMKKNQETEVVK
jgi:hypothetical protein